jgi:excisionase family DNA binding protein
MVSDSKCQDWQGRRMTQTITIPTVDEQPLMPVWPDAAAHLGLPRSTAYRLAEVGRFPVEVVKVGSKLRVRTADLRRFLGLD